MQARLIGYNFKTSKISFSEILTSEWCRCIDTAKELNLGKWETFSGLNSFFEGHEKKDKVMDKLRKKLNSLSHSDLILLITHQVVILEQTGIMVLRAIALHLKLPEFYFDNKVTGGNSILRAIHYPPITSEPKGAVRAAAHGDINLITILMGASAEGLEIQTRNGNWIGVTALPNQVVINIGDMMSRLTNDTLHSSIHQVVNPPKKDWGKPRFSIPFFMHPRSEMLLNCLPSCVSEKNTKKYTDITAGEFLDERIKELGLKK